MKSIVLVSGDYKKALCYISDLSCKYMTNRTMHCYIALDKLLVEYIVINGKKRGEWKRVEIPQRDESNKKVQMHFVGHINPEDGLLYLYGNLILQNWNQDQHCSECDMMNKNLLVTFREHKLKHKKN